MDAFVLDYKIINKKQSSYVGVYGSQLKTPAEELLDVVLLINVNVEKSQEDLSKITKFVSEDFLSYISSKINDGVSYLDILDSIQSRLEYIVTNVIEKDQKLKEQGLDINLMISFRENLFYYILLFGDIEAQIKRDEAVVSISDILAESGSSKSQFKTGSLQLKNTDRLSIVFLKSTSDLPVNTIATNAIENLNIVDVLAEYEDSLENSCLVILLMANEHDAWPETDLNTQKGEAKDGVEDDQENLYDEAEEVGTDMVRPNLELRGKNQRITPVLNSTLSKFRIMMLGIKEKLAQFSIKNTSDYNEVNIESQQDELEDRKEDYDNEYYNDSKKDSYRDITGATSFLSNLATKFRDAKKQLMSRNYLQSPFFQKVKLSFSNFIRLLLEFFLKHIIGTKDFDRRNARKKKQNLMRNRVILLFFVIVLVFFITRSIQEAEVERKRVETLNTTNNQLKSLSNRFQSVRSQLIQSQPVSVQTRGAILIELNSIKSELQKNTNIKELFANEFNLLDIEINNFIDEVNQVVPIKDPQIISDINIFFPDAKVSSATLVGSNVFVSDSNRNVIYRLPTTGSAVPPQVFVTGLVQPFLLVPDLDNNVIFYDNDVNNGVGRFSSTQENVLTRFQGLSPATIGRPITASVFFGNGALYEVVPINKQIFKRIRQGNSFIGGGAVPTNDATNWVTDNRLVNTIQIKTPYSIYVLVKGEGVIRFLAGADTNLGYEKYQDLTNEDYQLMKNATAFDISEKYMAVAVPAKPRIMIFEKIGDEINFQGFKYLKSLEYRGTQNLFKNISNLFLLESENKIIILDGSKVIQVNIN